MMDGIKYFWLSFILVSMTTARVHRLHVDNGNTDVTNLEFVGQKKKNVPIRRTRAASPGLVIVAGGVNNQVVYNVGGLLCNGQVSLECNDGYGSHSFGVGNNRHPDGNGIHPFGEGGNTNPDEDGNHPFGGGYNTDPHGHGSHPFGGGYNTNPDGDGSHPFGFGGGYNTNPDGHGSHPFGEGGNTNPDGHGSHPFGGGYNTNPEGDGSHRFGEGGNTNPDGDGNHPFGGGYNTDPHGHGSHPFGGGYNTNPDGDGSHPFGFGGGYNTNPDGHGSHPFGGGHNTNPDGYGSHPFEGGYNTNPGGNGTPWGGGKSRNCTGPCKNGQNKGILNATGNVKQLIINVDNNISPQFILHFEPYDDESSSKSGKMSDDEIDEIISRKFENEEEGTHNDRVIPDDYDDHEHHPHNKRLARRQILQPVILAEFPAMVIPTEIPKLVIPTEISVPVIPDPIATSTKVEDSMYTHKPKTNKSRTILISNDPKIPKPVVVTDVAEPVIATSIQKPVVKYSKHQTRRDETHPHNSKSSRPLKIIRSKNRQPVIITKIPEMAVITDTPEPVIPTSIEKPPARCLKNPTRREEAQTHTSKNRRPLKTLRSKNRIPTKIPEVMSTETPKPVIIYNDTYKNNHQTTRPRRPLRARRPMRRTLVPTTKQPARWFRNSYLHKPHTSRTGSLETEQTIPKPSITNEFPEPKLKKALLHSSL